MINSHDVTSDATKKVVLQYFENSIDHNAGVQKFIPDGWWCTREFCDFLPKTFSLFLQFCTLPHCLTGKFALQNLQEIWRKSCHFGIFAVPLNLNKYFRIQRNDILNYFQWWRGEGTCSNSGWRREMKIEEKQEKRDLDQKEEQDPKKNEE